MRAQIKSHEQLEIKQEVLDAVYYLLTEIPTVECNARQIGDKMIVVYAPIAHSRDKRFLESLAARSNVQSVRWVYGWEDLVGLLATSLILLKLLRHKITVDSWR